MENKLMMNILAANAVVGLILCGAEAPTMAQQVLVSGFGFFLFAGAAWAITVLMRNK